MYVHIDKRWRRYILTFWYQTPFHYAAGNGKGDVVEILVRNGASINEKNVKNISVGETDDFQREQEQRKRDGRRAEFNHSHLFCLWNILSHPSFIQQKNVCIISNSLFLINAFNLDSRHTLSETLSLSLSSPIDLVFLISFISGGMFCDHFQCESWGSCGW